MPKVLDFRIEIHLHQANGTTLASGLMMDQTLNAAPIAFDVTILVDEACIVVPIYIGRVSDSHWSIATSQLRCGHRTHMFSI